MKIIISPTKQMVTEQDFFFPETTPQFLTEAKEILAELKKLSYEEAKALWKCNDKLAQENFERIKHANLDKGTSPAVMSYKGLQYQYMAPDLLTEPALDYIQQHLRILSGFYGVLKPFDGIIPYRLEMQAPLAVGESNNLYQFWSKKLYDALEFDKGPIINLASKEYSKAIQPYLKENDQLIEVSFAQLVDGKPKVKATLAKMARGEMVRFLSEKNVTQLDDIKQFDHPNYHFSESLSIPSKFTFLYEE
ncbi:peroxide stress protein YaaA [Vagococcus fluvialis]|uniref:peroxide stress protein YaaA n=1 Tax=Vagococcus fluvialis TaxID=2738 RepID=UPI003B5CE226